MASPHVPRLLIYFLSFAFAIVSIGAGASAFKKGNDQKNYVYSHLLQTVTANIDTSDTLTVGGVLLGGDAGLALISLLAFIATIFRRHTPKRIDGILLGFFTFWIFVVDIANTVINRNRSAKVTAELGGVPLQPAVIQAQQQLLGVSSKYWDQSIIRFFTIVSWITFLFGALATAVSFLTVPPSKTEAKA